MTTIWSESIGGAPALRLRGIHRRFDRVQANVAVDLMVEPGHLHAILGERGAGKSTLLAILCGQCRPDGGDLWVHGHPAHWRHAGDALAMGVGMVHQQPVVVPGLSVLDHVMLGAEPGWRLGPARARARSRVQALMADSGLALPLEQPAQALTLAERRWLDVLRAQFRGVRVLLLDEPGAGLSPTDAALLFGALRRLRQAGTTLLLSTHRVSEVLTLCDAVTVLRRGHVVLDCRVPQTDEGQLSHAMAGRAMALGRGDGPPLPVQPAAAQAPVVLAAHALHWTDGSGARAVDGVSLALREGEIVGLGGMPGHGATELLMLLAGLQVPAHGTLAVAGRRLDASRWPDPAQVRALGVAHVPADRHSGQLPALPAWETAMLGHQWRARYCGRWGWLNRALLRSDTADLMTHHDVRPPQPNWRAAQLTEGNRQKLVLARELLAQPRVLLAGEPTRGLELGAIESMRERLRLLREHGGAVLLASADPEELLALSDRVLVMRQGRIVAERPASAWSEAALWRWMTGAVDVAAAHRAAADQAASPGAQQALPAMPGLGRRP